MENQEKKSNRGGRRDRPAELLRLRYAHLRRDVEYRVRVVPCKGADYAKLCRPADYVAFGEVVHGLSGLGLRVVVQQDVHRLLELASVLC